jgi:hypothetical protein
MLYVIAMSKRHKVVQADGKPIIDGIKAFEGMQLGGTITGAEIKVGLCFGRIFQMDDSVNQCDDVHLVLLGDFTEDERSDMGRYFTSVAEATPVEEYKNLSGDVIRYAGGRQALDLLMGYISRKTKH